MKVLDQTSSEEPLTSIRMALPSRNSPNKLENSLDSTHGLMQLLKEEMDTTSSRTQEWSYEEILVMFENICELLIDIK